MLDEVIIDEADEVELNDDEIDEMGHLTELTDAHELSVEVDDEVDDEVIIIVYVDEHEPVDF